MRCCVKESAPWSRLVSDEHLSVDGTLIEAWASHKSFKRKARRLTVGADKGYDCKAFGWIKTVGGLAKTKLIGHAKLTGQALMCLATYNLVRMGSIGGWWDAHHA